ncbi:MAG: YbaK/EbsC family protein [archaeon]
MEPEDRLKNYIRDNMISAEHLVFDASCHSVSDAAKAASVDIIDIVKNVCFMDDEGIIVAIVKGEDRADMKKISGLCGSDVRIATPDEILRLTKFKVGGVPSFGYHARFFIDKKVMDREYIITGGGSDRSLVRISPANLQKANQGRIEDIRK